MADKLVYTVKELADALQVSMPTAYALTESKDFPVVIMGRKKLIPIAALERWLSEQAKKR